MCLLARQLKLHFLFWDDFYSRVPNSRVGRWGWSFSNVTASFLLRIIHFKTDRERDTERETERETERDTERDTQRETHRETHRERHTERDTQRDTEIMQGKPNSKADQIP